MVLHLVFNVQCDLILVGRANSESTIAILPMKLGIGFPGSIDVFAGVGFDFAYEI